MILTLHIILPIYLPLFCLFLFSSSYYKFVTLSHFMHILLSHTKRFTLSLSLSLSLSLIFFFSFFVGFFYEVCTLIVLLLTNSYVFLDASFFFYHFICDTKYFLINVVDQIWRKIIL